jgi:hypothetical protein
VMIKRRGSIMPTIFDFLYHEYCRARLAEMRKQLLLVSAENHVVPEPCDVSHPGDSGGRDTATQHEARSPFAAHDATLCLPQGGN